MSLFDITRRFALAGAAGLTLLPTAANAGQTGKAVRRLWYRQPAAIWDEALPIGNGRMGAMVFGGVAQERLQLNEDTLWAGGPYTPDNPEALAALPEVRRLLNEGRFTEATELASAKVMARPLRQMSYGTFGDVLVTFPGAVVPTRYERELTLEDAICASGFSAGGREIRREAFASAPDQVVVLRLEAEGGGLDCDFAWRAPRWVQHTSPAYQGPATPPIGSREIDWLAVEDAGDLPEGFRIAADGPSAWLITGVNVGGENTPAALTFALRVEVLSDGAVEATDAALRLRGARSATVLISMATSYRRFDDVSGDPVALVRATGRAAAGRPYAELRRRHVADYRALFEPVSLDLGGSAAAARPTDQRIAASGTGGDPALAALYFDFARYLLISSSRPGSQPANLQGIWNEGVGPPWGSKYTININTEMNYWPADPAGLGVCVEPLLRMVEELSITGARTARTMYGARGWVTHHNTDLWRAAAPIDGPMWGLWPCGGAWLCNTLWDHWDYGRDPAVLERLYPLMKGASLFFLDTLVEDPGGRGLVTSPSLSPENHHPFGSSLCVGPAMDRQIVRDLFERTGQAAAILGRDADFAASLDAASARIAPDRIGKSGQLQEWLEDWDDAAPDQNHRHVSHLYGVYPGSQINVRDTPDLIQAARVSLDKRGDYATGWGTAWRLCLWARMGDGERAHAVLKGLTGPQRTYPNMFDAHPPFQIDGNFGGAAGIMEMLVQSWGGEVHLLPALPRAWPTGALKGVRVRGGVAVDMDWEDGRLARLLLKGPPETGVRLRYGAVVRTVTLDHRGAAPVIGPDLFGR
ncbi:glycoside hydrolase family 95 protein [Brevundimonas sp.]|uniref:glycoside hydrolase family 95 protein n=1 Tax=Brevundimonas sp. TaxID=1871086 RepID=UPI002D39A764|nr:glycoside hydrolase family 95 protein [Brevundimonas sp.]HYC97718.1 glycoside hydrolase family 95 protein [Brevundimonas sp.]